MNRILPKLLIILATIIVFTASYSLLFPKPKSAAGVIELSVAKLKRAEIKTAYSLHPDACALEGSKEDDWIVSCRGLPMHFYQQITLCEGLPEVCGPPPATYSDCETIEWKVGRNFEPSSLFGTGRQYDSLNDDCLPRASFEADREEMVRRNIALIPVKVFNFTGKPKLAK